MPRLIPRLLNALSKISENPKPFSHSPPRPSSTRETTRPQNTPVPNVISHHNRQRSVLLDEVNPITDRNAFRKKKTLQPLLRAVPPASKSSKTQEDDGLASEHRRVMTVEERQWWANPYLRMLASPMRECVITNVKQPSDFMIRLARMHIPESHSGQKSMAFFPDGMEHPRYRGKKAGTASYMLCYKDVVEHFFQSKPHQKRYLDTILPPDSSLIQHIGHVLRTRVIQELELLGERLRCRPVLSREAPVLRPLLRKELQEIMDEGFIRQEGAIAVLVAPPLDLDPTSKQQAESLSPAPPIPEVSKDDMKTENPPISQLYPVRAEQNISATDDNSLTSLTAAKVPLYNGDSLFPDSSQRAEFHRVLNNVLRIEGRARRSQPPSDNDLDQIEGRRNLDRKDLQRSDAYILYSSAKTLERADSVPLAIALWRVRMWEGGGWDNDRNGTGIYMRNPPWFDRNAE